MKNIEYSDLIKARKFLEEKVNYPLSFPYGQCIKTSMFLKDIFGLEQIAGKYLGKNWHCWNYDEKNEVYIDLTMDQFRKENGRKNKSIEVIPIKNNILIPNKEDTKTIRQLYLNGSQEFTRKYTTKEIAEEYLSMQKITIPS